jgi:predicted nucleic acid-binding protein
MTRLVVDASIVIKWSVPEVHSADALRYLDPDLERDAPELPLTEASNMVSGGQADWLDRREFSPIIP